MTINELEAHFAALQLPQAVDLYKGVKITDVRKFVASHVAVIQFYGLKSLSQPFFDRLIHLKDIIKDQQP